MILRYFRTLRYRWYAYQFDLMSRTWDERIEAARSKHQSVKHLQAAKTEWLHAALRGRG